MQNILAAEKYRVLLISGNNNRIKDPKSEHYWDMLRSTCCPVISCVSITTVILIAQVTLYITSIVKGIDEDKELLQIKAQVLLDLGANF